MEGIPGAGVVQHCEADHTKAHGEDHATEEESSVAPLLGALPAGALVALGAGPAGPPARVVPAALAVALGRAPAVGHAVEVRARVTVRALPALLAADRAARSPRAVGKAAHPRCVALIGAGAVAAHAAAAVAPAVLARAVGRASTGSCGPGLDDVLTGRVLPGAVSRDCEGGKKGGNGVVGWGHGDRGRSGGA